MKNTHSTLQLCDATMRHDGMPLKGSYSWSSVRVGGGIMLRRHPLTGEAPDVIKAPLLVAVPFERGEWRIAYRTLTPEKDAPALGTLRRAWELNKARVSALATRRKPWSVRVTKFLKGKKCGGGPWCLDDRWFLCASLLLQPCLAMSLHVPVWFALNPVCLLHLS